MYLNPIEVLLNTVAMHRSLAALALSEEARLAHENLASWYSAWAEAERRRVDFSAITRDIALAIA